MTGTNFARELRDAAARRKVAPRLISDAPEEWRLGPLTVRIDRRRNAAVLRYARLPVKSGLPCNGEEILGAWQRTLTRLIEASVAPLQLVDALARAYQRVLDAESKPLGQRVLLSRLFPEVTRALAKKAYPRSQFAFDLARLRRERMLTVAGRRLDFGVATGEAATRRQTVLWLEDESGNGQYYLHFRMLPDKERARDDETP